MTKPNILYLHSHDTGRYVQPYGYAVPTPNLQKLAETGVLFRQCYCAAPVCSASRAALLCGQSAHGAGMIGLAHRGFRLADYGRHIAATLRANGYRTALAGTQHVAAEKQCRQLLPYDEFLDYGPDGKSLGEAGLDIAERAAGFLARAGQSRAGAGQARPFFLAVGFGETHRTFPEKLSPKADPRYVRPPDPIPDTPETRADMAGFITSAIALDAQMGRVLDALDAAGLADNTLVICTTDHGLPFPRMKSNLTDGGIGVMLMMRGPSGFTVGFLGGRVCDALVSHVDIFPTVCEVAGIAPPDWLEGKSIVPLIDGRAESIREELFAEMNYHTTYEPMRCIRTRRYKYIRRFGPGPHRPMPCNLDDSPSKTLWIDNHWLMVPLDAECLYDVILDPAEQNNLADCHAMKPVIADLWARLDAWMKATEDPLLAGGVPAPAGAVLNYRDALSPREPKYTLEKPEVALRKKPRQ
jgi:arylsulfatase A-like enzyme